MRSSIIMDKSLLNKTDVENVLESVLKKEDIINAELKISCGSEKGDGYLSVMTKVDAIGKNKNLHVVIKAAPRFEEYRKKAPLHLCYTREIMFYNTLMPAFKKFQDDRGVANPFKSVAKCYKTIEDDFAELLVLEDIRENGFRLWDRKKCMDDAHFNLLFKVYGKFHAISYAMKDQDNELYQDLTKDITDIFTKENFDPIMFDIFTKEILNIKELFSEETEKDIRDSLQKLYDNFFDFFLDPEQKNSNYSIITHGDCWCNNMMFKYEDKLNPSKPTEVCLLDFQIIRMASPVFDLSYFFYLSSTKEIMDNLDHYLKIYHDSLTSHMMALGSKPEKAISFKELKNQWKLYGKHGFILSLVIFKAMMSEKDEIVSFENGGEAGEEFATMFSKEFKNEDVINDKYRILVTHLYKNGFL